MAITPTLKTIAGPTREAAAQAATRPAPAGFGSLLDGLLDPAVERPSDPGSRQNPDGESDGALERVVGERSRGWPMSMIPALDPYGGLIQTRQPLRLFADDQNPDVLQREQADDGSIFDEPFAAERSAGAGPAGKAERDDASPPQEYRFAVNREMRMLAAQTVIAMPLDNYALAQKVAPEASRIVAAAEPAREVRESRRAGRGRDGSVAALSGAARADEPAASARSGRTGAARPQAPADAGQATQVAVAPARGGRPKIYLSSMPARPHDADLGMLSSRFESHVHGASAIGHDERGGTSYGRYQLSSRHGMVDAFIHFLRDKAPDWGKRLKAAGAADTGGQQGAMPQVWRALAKEDPGRLERLQHEFILRAFYQPAVERVRAATGRDLGELSSAVRESLWSAAVQHGPGGAATIFIRAVKRVDKLGLQGVEYERALINEAYKVRRGRFGGLSPEVQAAVGSRLKKEQSMALSMLVMTPAPTRSGEA